AAAPFASSKAAAPSEPVASFRLPNPDRGDEVVPSIVAQVPDVGIEVRGSPFESDVLENEHLGAAENADRRDLIVHAARHPAQLVTGADAEIVAAEIRILEEAHAVARESLAPPALRHRRGRDGERCEQRNEEGLSQRHDVLLSPGENRRDGCSYFT